MLQICSDKSQLLQALDDGVFHQHISLLRTQRCPQLLAIMIETCYCDGVPIPQNQRRCQALKLLVFRALKLLFFRALKLLVFRALKLLVFRGQPSRVPIPQNQRRWAFCLESPDTYSSNLRPLH